MAGEMRSGFHGATKETAQTADNRGIIRDVTAPARAKRGWSRFSEADWARAEADFRAGMTARDVSERHGMSQSAIYKRFGRRPDVEASRQASADAAVATPMVRKLATALHRIFGALDEPTRMFVQAIIDAWKGLSASNASSSTDADGQARTRVYHTAAIWMAARRDYEIGNATVAAIAERYKMTVNGIEGRIYRERWSKTVTEAPPPLLPPDDPDQIDASGASIWQTIAHAAQRPPAGAWSTWLFQGGRGAGKTRAGAEWLAARAEATPNGAFAIIAATEHDLREVMIEGPAGLRSLPGREHPRYESSRRRLRWTNGAVAYGFSAEQPERLRGPQFMAAWADEFCTWKKPHAVLSNLRLGLRLGSDPRLLITTTPKPMQALRDLRAEASCVMTQAPTSANAEHLAPSFIDGLTSLYGGTRLAEQELDGVLVEDAGGLFRTEDFAARRCEAPAKGLTSLEQVVVAIDPPAGLEGSACGIVVAGRAIETRIKPDGAKVRERVAYVLADHSCTGKKPLEWAEIAAQAVRDHGAAKIVAEANQGGEMVRQTLRSAGVICPIELVHASKGKCVRAEPVSVLYQRGLVRHCGHFRDLERELLGMGVESGEETGNDRADALVWAITSLKLITNVAAAPGIRRL